MIAVDSSVVVAGLLSWHEFHERALQPLEKAMAARRPLIPFPVLVESYSVIGVKVRTGWVVEEESSIPRRKDDVNID